MHSFGGFRSNSLLIKRILPEKMTKTTFAGEVIWLNATAQKHSAKFIHKRTSFLESPGKRITPNQICIISCRYVN